MPKRSPLNDVEKGKLETFHQEKVGISEIARRIGRSHQVVLNYLKNPAGYGKIERNLTNRNFFRTG